MSDRVTARRRPLRLLNILLLPVAILVVLVEDVVWAACRAALRAANAWAPVRRLRALLATLPGYAALPLFLVPELLGRVGEIWAVALLVEGHVASAVGVYALVRVVATLLAVFIYQACQRALLQIGWFARVEGWVHAARVWAVTLIQPAVAAVRRALPPGGRLAALRHVLRRWLRLR